jgi:hypothetical protein
VVVPPSGNNDIINEETMVPLSDTTTYMPPEPLFNLTIHRASYHVEAATGPVKPVYEHTGELVTGNEST